MDTNEIENVGIAVVLLIGCFFIIGIIFHILGLWFNISIWVERTCCLALIICPYFLFFPPSNSSLDKLKAVATLFVLYGIAFGIDKNQEQVDRKDRKTTQV